MSKAFKKDDDEPSAPLHAPRAPLPDSLPNYVTEVGLAALQAEHAELTRSLSDNDADLASRALTKAKLAELTQRIACAVLVDPRTQNHDEVRFGATVQVLDASGQARRYSIVGVDEANAALGKVAFIAPLARALLGKRVGDSVLVRAPHGEDELEIVGIEYASASPA